MLSFNILDVFKVLQKRKLNLSTFSTFQESVRTKTGFEIRTIQEGGGVPAFRIVPAFILPRTAILNKEDINTHSPNKTCLAKAKSLMELEIINKKAIHKLLAETR